MSPNNAARWVKFFEAAGLPSSVSASYAHIFVEHRIQTDMLMDLNKDYLKEMGIHPTGDIIAILRHSKHVTEQSAREKVLSTQASVPVATVPANKSTKTIRLNPITLPNAPVNENSNSSSENSTSSLQTHKGNSPPKPRRVLPEHEGRYKITLPSGTTKRSREILAKKALLQSNMVNLSKASIFGRLGTEEKSEIPETVQTINLVGLTKSTPSSVFNRLGNKQTETTISDSKLSKGILKNASPIKKTIITTTSNHGISKKNLPKKSNVMLVKKIPAKATMMADEIERMERMELSEPMKTVSFSSEDEVVEIAPRRLVVKPRIKKVIGVSIKTRLGGAAAFASNSSNKDPLKQTRKVISFKNESQRSKQLLTHKLKSDQLKNFRNIPIHKRLDFGKKDKSIANNLLAKRLEKVRIDNSNGTDSNAASVFNRLG